MNQHGYIYRVTNKLNGTVYVGQRRGEFVSWYLGSGRIIKRAVQKHGIENFMLEFVQSAFNQEQLDLLEKFWISEARRFGETYNIRDGGLGSLFMGHGPFHGKKFSEESRAKLSASRTGMKNPFFGRSDLLGGCKNPMFGKKQSPETRQKIGQALAKNKGSSHGNFGKKRSPETLAKMRDVTKRYWDKKRAGAEI